MKQIGKLSLALLVMLSFWACQKQPAQTVAPEEPLPTFMDSVSYAYGVIIGSELENNDIEGMRGDIIGKGILAITDTSAAKDSSLLMNEEEAKALFQKFVQELQEKKERELKQKGIDYLNANKKRPGVIALPNGLQYEVLRAGNGAKPSVSDQVKVHYHGMLTDGTVFDSSVERGQPATFGLRQVISGWTEILQLMPVGSKWKVYIPQEMAYGARGAGGSIPPYSTLVFEIDLLDIVNANTPAHNHGGHDHDGHGHDH